MLRPRFKTHSRTETHTLVETLPGFGRTEDPGRFLILSLCYLGYFQRITGRMERGGVERHSELLRSQANPR